MQVAGNTGPREGHTEQGRVRVLRAWGSFSFTEGIILVLHLTFFEPLCVCVIVGPGYSTEDPFTCVKRMFSQVRETPSNS